MAAPLPSRALISQPRSLPTIEDRTPEIPFHTVETLHSHLETQEGGINNNHLFDDESSDTMITSSSLAGGVSSLGESRLSRSHIVLRIEPPLAGTPHDDNNDMLTPRVPIDNSSRFSVRDPNHLPSPESDTTTSVTIVD